jgi:FPC/CPF motif-containing protein YcgG
MHLAAENPHLTTQVVYSYIPTVPTNPFLNAVATENSCYCRPEPSVPSGLIRVDGGKPSDLVAHVHSQFKAMIISGGFPCVLGRSALKNDSYRFAFYDDMTSADSVQGLCHDLFDFVQEQPLTYEFSTFVTCFCNPQPQSESHFEKLLWELLQALHDQDSVHHEWDPSTSSDPENGQFSFSFAGRSYFVVGLHHGSSRFSRRFTYPTVVFNAHYQFENLKKENKFEHFQKVIRGFDTRLQGNINPSLTDYGDDSEARQYSGRLVEKNWKCPFVLKKE